MGRSILCLAGVGLSLALAIPVSAQSSDEGAAFLLLPLGAKASAMGRAVTALPSPESAFWNPAGLAATDHSQVLLTRADIAVGSSTAASVLLAKPGVGTVGFSYLLRDEGDQDYTDSFGSLLGRVSFRNHLFMLSAAAGPAPGLDIGASFKVVQEKNSCRGNCFDGGRTSTAYAVDLGAQWAPDRDVPLRLGAVVAHLGPRYQVQNASQADPLPTRIRLGVAYDVLAALERPGLRGWVSVELEDRPGYSGDTRFSVGSEVSGGEEEAFFVRVGYAGDGVLPGGPRAGLGLRLSNYEVSVAKSLSGSSLDIEAPLTVSMAVRW